MSIREYRADRLDVAAFARDAGRLEGELPLAALGRLNDSLHAGAPSQRTVRWSATGRTRTQRGGAFETWLDLQAEVVVPLTCQICLEAVDTLLAIDRSFRFVASEAQAAELDEESEEDVLVSNRQFDLVELIEDELLLALPLVPRHDECPTRLPFDESPLAIGPMLDADEHDPEEAQRENPFAALARLKTPPH